jgi:hypothetical protein
MQETWVIGIFTAIGTGLSVLLASLGAQWRLSMWLAKQFTEFRNMMDDLKTDILDKLEYHERHDDERFSEVRKDLSDIRLKNAVRDALIEKGRVLDEKKSSAE